MPSALQTMLMGQTGATPAAAGATPPPTDTGNSVLTRAGASPALVQMLDSRRASHSQLADTALEELSDINTERQRIAGEIEAVSDARPAPPQLPETPEPPPSSMPGNGARVFGQMLPVLAMLGGLFVQRDATAALRTGAAAMRAARANDEQELALQHQHWEDQVERITSERQATLQEYQSILQDSSATVNEKLAQLNALAARENNIQLRAQVSAGDLAGINDNIRTQMSANTALRQQLAADRGANARGRGGGGAAGGGALETHITAAGNVISAIGRARELAETSGGTTGLQGQIFRGIGGTRARDLDALVDTISSNIGFDRLQQMRDNSPTGGALGQVSEMELRLLMAVVASLDTSQSQEQFLENLDRVETKYKASMERMAQAYQRDVASGLIDPSTFYTDIFSASGVSGGGGVSQPSEDPVEGDVVDGYRFLGGDPADPNSWESVQ